ncbi:MAG: sulfotransferase [Rhodobacteraceae bacterium]|nr:sulfotransferase [Paracoccaceae bacterium]
MAQATVLYGIGAAKAGTSWLHGYLSSHPECHFRSIKEVHYFDTLDQPDWRGKLLFNKMIGLTKLQEAADGDSLAKIEREISDFTDWQRVLETPSVDHSGYLDYLQNGSEGYRIIGDITPSYANLNADIFSEMAGIGPQVKFIYLLRDPLDRLWSNIRMAAQRFSGGGKKLAATARALMEDFLTGNNRQMERRTEYASTLQNLYKAVGHKQVLIEFYETLFTSDATRRITDFLGLSPMTAPTDKIVHRGQRIDLDEDQRRRALVRLRPQYEYVMQHVNGPIPARWHTQLSEV